MVEWRKWRSRVRVSVFEEGTERPGSEVEAETTVVAPGPETAIMEALAWTRRHYVPVSAPADQGLDELVDGLLDAATDDLLDDRAFAELERLDELLDRPLFSPDGRRALRAAIARRDT